MYPKSNAPKAEQRRVASIVHTTVRRTGGDRGRWHPDVEPKAAPPARATQTPRPRQLGLDL
jgi:hypothetical protein